MPLLLSVSERRVLQGKVPHCFVVQTPKRDYLIATASAAESKAWVSAIEAHLAVHFAKAKPVLQRSTSLSALPSASAPVIRDDDLDALAALEGDTVRRARSVSSPCLMFLCRRLEVRSRVPQSRVPAASACSAACPRAPLRSACPRSHCRRSAARARAWV